MNELLAQNLSWKKYRSVFIIPSVIPTPMDTVIFLVKRNTTMVVPRMAHTLQDSVFKVVLLTESFIVSFLSDYQ